MKIIDLLNKIANGEEVPKKIKYKNIIWYFNKKDKTYYMNNTEIELFYIEKLIEKLNDEVEILDDEDMEDKTKPLTKKDIEALGYACGEIKKCFEMGWNKSLKNKPLEEEKKIPEKLFHCCMETDNDEIEFLIKNINDLADRYNDLLDYLKSKSE